MKEEYGSGFDGTPEQALKYAQDTPGQELEVKRLLKLIRSKKMSKILKIVKEVIKDKLLREQATSGWKTTVTKNRKPTTATATATEKPNENVGGWIVSGQEAKKLKKLLPPPLPEQNPR
jgi:SET domain-containing protein